MIAPLAFRFSVMLFTASWACLGTPPHARADIRLPSVFGDSMVLQRDKPIRIWGWCDADEKVTVTLGEYSANGLADTTGRWQVELPARQACSDPQTIIIKGKNQRTIKDVLIGEVWLCSGQSNMEWTVAASLNAKQEIAAADFPRIRHIKVPHVVAMTPQDDFDGSWQVCSPEVVGQFTACGYFMGRKLHAELDVPIGLINSSWGGTRVDPWIPLLGYQTTKGLEDTFASIVGRTPGTSQYTETLGGHVAATQGWLAKANRAITEGTGVEASPTYPASLIPFSNRQDPTVLYNAMIYPVLGYPIRGAIWYQGESNHNEGMAYLDKKRALINGWRELWKTGDFPFFYVQIAPYQYGDEDASILPRFWEAQAAVEKEVPDSAMVIINDVATLNNIHPPNKQVVGDRLAGLALKKTYGRDDLVAESPTLKSIETNDGLLRLTFENTGGGLITRDGKPPTHFEIIDADSGGYQSADATIVGDIIELRSAKVNRPTAFRFAWHKLAEPNLTGGTGLPVGAVREGKVPAFTDTLPLGEYELVYDLDLSKLGSTITYDVDRSDEVESLSRIAYLVELTLDGGTPQAVFVSMDAFTNNVKHIGIPTAASGAVFQQTANAMTVMSNVSGITNGTDIKTGNLEFWPHNYGKSNDKAVPGASSGIYDFGDGFSAPVDGYGCMQVHNFGAKETLFAINQWKSGRNADLGIGNSQGETRDWTFKSNASTYSQKRLRIYVKP